MISQVQNTDPLALVSLPRNPRASELYTQGSSFHDLFTSAAEMAPQSAPIIDTQSAAKTAVSNVAAAVSQAQPAAPTAPAPPVIPDLPPPPTFERNAVVTAPDGSTTALNPMEMASASTAAQIAAKLGGTVSPDQFAGFTTSADIREISFTGSNIKINAGLAATLFANYGDAPGSQAWRIINRDLGRDPMSTGSVS